jgi:hypothetical protein
MVGGDPFLPNESDLEQASAVSPQKPRPGPAGVAGGTAGEVGLCCMPSPRMAAMKRW